MDRYAFLPNRSQSERKRLGKTDKRSIKSKNQSRQLFEKQDQTEPASINYEKYETT
jgi:hypothetical protein